MQDKEKVVKLLNEWVVRYAISNTLELKDCAKTYTNWIEEIQNLLAVPYSNGPIEGYNKKIKL